MPVLHSPSEATCTDTIWWSLAVHIDTKDHSVLARSQSRGSLSGYSSQLVTLLFCRSAVVCKANYAASFGEQASV